MLWRKIKQQTNGKEGRQSESVIYRLAEKWREEKEDDGGSDGRKNTEKIT